VTFHYLAGNNDARGKNFSLLHHRVDETRLAPLYDVVCAICYPELSRESSADQVTLRSFEQLRWRPASAKPSSELASSRPATRPPATSWS
jgi:serine/threonine-protein kinase HipA